MWSYYYYILFRFVNLLLWCLASNQGSLDTGQVLYHWVTPSSSLLYLIFTGFKKSLDQQVHNLIEWGQLQSSLILPTVCLGHNHLRYTELFRFPWLGVHAQILSLFYIGSFCRKDSFSSLIRQNPTHFASRFSSSGHHLSLWLRICLLLLKICTMLYQAGYIWQHGVGEAPKAPHLLEKLLAVDGCQEEESLFFQVWPL